MSWLGIAALFGLVAFAAAELWALFGIMRAAADAVDEWRDRR